MPGVGAFAAVMAQLPPARGGELIDRRLAGGRPVLGICVGMQVLFERGVERGVDVEGLGEWPGVVEPLDAPVLPHMGWNTVEAPAGSRLFAGLADERFYFVHSYGARGLDARRAAAAPGRRWSPGPTHGGPFVAAVENGPLSATQFHPEKSGAGGHPPARQLAGHPRADADPRMPHRVGNSDRRRSRRTASDAEGHHERLQHRPASSCSPPSTSPAARPSG